MVCDTIHRYHLELRSTFLECRPLELSQHRRYAASVMKVSSDTACIYLYLYSYSNLYSNLFDISLNYVIFNVMFMFMHVNSVS